MGILQLSVRGWLTFHPRLCRIESGTETTPHPFDASTLDRELDKRIFGEALSWQEEEGASLCVGGDANRVVRVPSFQFSSLPCAR